MKNVEKIENYLDSCFENPDCELNYNKDYELLLAVMLSAQTTDKRVNKVTKVLFEKYDSLEALNEAPIDDIKKIIREIGTYNKKATFIKEIANILVTKYNSTIPRTREELETLPGVGRKTVNVLFGELNIEPAIAVDTHVERVSKRLNLAKQNDSVLIVEKKLQNAFKKDVWSKRHKQLVLFGRYKCKAMKPECDECNIINICRYKREVK